MAKRRKKRKRKVPMMKDDIQRTANANLDATMNSFGVVTKGTQALFVLFARHDDPNFELAKVRRSRGGVSFGWTSQSESHTLVHLNHDNAFVAFQIRRGGQLR
jgi:hypothetical protein